MMQSRHVASIGFLLGIAFAALACGGKQTEPKTPEDKPAEATSEESSSATEAAKPTSGETTAETPTAASSKPACAQDTSEVESKIGKVSVSTGCLSAKAAEKILAQYFKDLHGCFSKELARDRKAKGGVTIRINVGQKGTYSVRVTKSEASSEEYVGCLISVLEPLPYPKPEEGGATIEYTTDLK